MLLIVITLTQCSMVYYPDLPSRELTATPEQIGLPFENVEFATSDQQTLHGWYIPAAEERGVLLFFHGNAGNISHRLDSIRIFNQLKLSVFIFDYRGYGNSSGKPSEKGTYQDAEAAINFLVTQYKLSSTDIIYFGRSLGGAVASHLAAKHPPKAIILESTFTSAPEMAGKLFPIFPMRWLIQFSYNNIDNLQSIFCPVLIVHSPEDEIIPYELGLKLYETANEPKQFLQIHGGHNEGFIISRKTYTEGLEKFIKFISTNNPTNENLNKNGSNL